MDVTGVLRQLYAVRLLVDGLIADLEPKERKDEDEATFIVQGCSHPEGRQVNATVMGGPPMVLCLACGAQRVGLAPEGS